MFDNLRQQSQQGPEDSGPEEAPAAESRSYTPSVTALGLTPAQRFVLAWILFILVTVLGCAVLILSGKIVVPLTF